MANLPAELSTGTVHGRFIIALIDGNDPDQEPDVIPAKGTIRFKSSVPYVPVPVTTLGPVTVMKGPVVGVLDNEGYLCTPNPVTGEIMYRGVKLIATDDPDMAVTDWTWTAEYVFESVGSSTMQIPAHSFSLTSGGSVDLTTVVKVPSSPGYGLPQAEAAVLRAEAAAQVALDVKAMADAGEFDGAQGLPGNATMRVDTTVGTRVFITDGTTERLVIADTGVRNILPLLSSGATATRATIRRIGDVVYLDVLGMKVPANGSITTIPATGFTGFRPDAQFSTFQPVGVGSAQSRLVIYGSTGATVFISGAQVADEYHLHLSWTVSQPWPTSLPGTPA